MITDNQIEEAFGRHLEAAYIADIVWPNATENLPPKPYLVVQHVPGIRRSPGLGAGGGEEVTGSFVVTVVTDVNKFSTQANDLAAEVMARFPRAVPIPCGDGKLRPGPQNPVALVAGRDGADWRQPVRIAYIATMR
ncbi:MAG TPA: hypothetical protein ENN65_08430 [Candidatus Hydrogenedentes bacterium]|nr:hypothetical protein [Candidatus Hydrogenedentota bacterium]